MTEASQVEETRINSGVERIKGVNSTILFSLGRICIGCQKLCAATVRRGDPSDVHIESFEV
jgi:hypothetical protein